MLTGLVVAAVTIAATTPDTMAGLYGNTLVAIDGGIESHFYYKPDHTFTGMVPKFYFKLSGSWREQPDGTICRVFDPPLPTIKNPDCGPMAVRSVGERKTFDNGDSQTLVQGIR